MALVVFCLYGNDEKMKSYAGMMVASCKRLGYEVWQLSDDAEPPVPMVDRILRSPMDCPQVTYRYRRLCEIDPPYISLDVDLIVVKDISGLLDDGYDATMTKRKNTEGMIYNGGVFSVQRRGFIEDCYEQIKHMRSMWQNWTGGQRAMVDAASRWNIKEVPCDEWNFTPDNFQEWPNGVRVLHFKGKEQRRKMMKRAYELLCT